MKVIGLVAGGIALFILVIALIVAAFSVYSTQNSSQFVVYPHNAEMTSMFRNAYFIEHHLRAADRTDVWPASLTVAPDGSVSYGSVVLGRLESGESLAYGLTDDGKGFQFAINGRVAGERVTYDSLSEEINGWCSRTDSSCRPFTNG